MSALAHVDAQLEEEEGEAEDQTCDEAIGAVARDFAT
jgi:hypothetical protein